MHKLTTARFLLAAVWLLTTATIARAQQPDPERRYCYLYRFIINRASFSNQLAGNSEAIKQIDKVIRFYHNNHYIDSVFISAYTSWDGGEEFNRNLGEQRAAIFRSYLLFHYPFLKNIPMEIRGTGEDWIAFRQAIVDDSSVPQQSALLSIVDNLNLSAQAKEQHIRTMNGGRTFRYLADNILPKQRRALICIVFRQKDNAPLEPDDPAIPHEILEPVPPVTKQVTTVEPQPEVSQPTIKMEPRVEVEQPLTEMPYPLLPLNAPQQSRATSDSLTLPITPTPQLAVSSLLSTDKFWAIKANLLQAAVGVANLGFEFPIGSRLSIDLPFTYSPYDVANDWRLRTLSTQPELRLWLGKQMQSVYLGLHAHAAYYNVSVDNYNRYQDKDARTPLYGYGLGLGFAFKLFRRLNLEFAAGGGYAHLDYDIFYNRTNGARYSYHIQKDYWGLTRAGITLSYKFFLNNTNLQNNTPTSK